MGLTEADVRLIQGVRLIQVSLYILPMQKGSNCIYFPFNIVKPREDDTDHPLLF